MRKVLGLVCFMAVSAATPAMAFLDVQLLGGQRSAKYKYDLSDGEHEKAVSSTEMGLALHVSPMKVLPMSFGVGVYQNSFDMKKIFQESMEDQNLTDADGNAVPLTGYKSTLGGMSYGPELMVWVPLKFIRPFIRVGYAYGIL